MSTASVSARAGRACLLCAQGSEGGSLLLVVQTAGTSGGTRDASAV